jgi:flagellin-like protein
MSRRYRRRRAVSDVVATLLMTAIVVSLGSAVFIFASGGLSSLTQGFTNLMTGSGNAVSEHVVVEQAVFFFSGTTGADVYVRNVGTISSTLVSVYIVDQSTGTFISQTGINQAVNVGTVFDVLHTTLTFTPSHGHSYSFTVSTSLGNSVIYNAVAA